MGESQGGSKDRQKSGRVDIAASSDNDSESVEDFKQKNGIQLPKDIVTLLTQQECQKPNPPCEW